MAELKREIEEKDIVEIKKLIKEVFNTDGEYKEIQRLGGMTNHSYKVTLNDDQEYLIRLPGEGTEEMINRSDERKSTELACSLDIDAELIYFNDDGRKVMRFISDSQYLDEEKMKEHFLIEQAADIFYKLHHCGIDTGVRFEVFEMADSYEQIILNNKVKLYDDYQEVKQTVMSIKKSIDAEHQTERVPCHNDSLIGNWVLDKNNRLWLIDWEYSGMNEPMWDLSCLSIEMGYGDDEDNYLLKQYFKKDVTSDEKKRFIAAKMYVDYLWTLWGLTRVPYDGYFMQEYADSRYKRLKNNILQYQSI